MNVNLLHEKLIRAAKLIEVPDAVPYAFEKRVLARVRAEGTVDGLALWARALWRAAVPCTLLMVALGIGTVTAPKASNGVTQTADLSAELETTLMASVSIDNTYDW